MSMCHVEIKNVCYLKILSTCLSVIKHYLENVIFDRNMLGFLNLKTSHIGK